MSMNIEEIQQYVDSAIVSQFEGFTSESGEIMTSEGGDGRFIGKVVATRYLGLPPINDFFLAIGETEQQVQIVKLGNAECLKPGKADLDMMLEKELGIKSGR